MSNHKSVTLYAGGLLTVNREGKVWTVDVWAHDWAYGDEPVYHASYALEADALEDASLWKTAAES